MSVQGIVADGVVMERRWAWARAVAVVIFCHFLLLFGLGLTRHWSFMTSLNDLGMFDQAVWGILHGKPFLNTSLPFNVPMNWLGWHFNPFLILFAPLYAIAEAPEWFVFAQAAALSLAAWPIFLLAKRVTGSEAVGGVWAVAYLANPFLLNAAAWDFHPVALAVPAIVLALLALETGNHRLLVGACLFLLTVQEQMGIVVAGFGALAILCQAPRRLGVLLIAVGFAHLVLVLGVIMPALSPTNSHPMMSSGLGHASRYGWMGSSLGEIATFPLRHPIVFADTVLVKMEGGQYLFALLLPFLFLPLFRPVLLLPGLADLAANLLSVTSMPRNVAAYHSVTLIPILTVAAIYGTRALGGWQRRFNPTELAGLALVGNLSLGYLLAPLPLPWAFDFWAPKHYAFRPDPELAEVRAALPSAASLSVQANVGAHFSQRNEVHLFPAGVGETDAIIVQIDSPTERKLGLQNPGEMATFAHHVQMKTPDYLDAVETLVNNPEYGVTAWHDPWLVFIRGAAATPTALRADILAKLARFRRKWQDAARSDDNESKVSAW